MTVNFLSAFIVGGLLKLVSPQYSVCNDEYCLWTDGQNKNIGSLEHAQSFCPAEKWLIDVTSSKLSTLAKILGYQYNLAESSILLNLYRGNSTWIWNNMIEANFPLQNGSVFSNYAAVMAKDSSGNIIFVADHPVTSHSYICMKKVPNVIECNKIGGWFNGDTCYFSSYYPSDSWYHSCRYCDEHFNATLAVFGDIVMSTIPGFWFPTLFLVGDEMYWVGLSKYMWTSGHSGKICAYNEISNGDTDMADKSQSCLRMQADRYEWYYTSCSGSFMIVCMSSVERHVPPATPSNEPSQASLYLAPMIAGWVVVGVFLIILVIVIVIFAVLKLFPQKASAAAIEIPRLSLSETYERNENYSEIMQTDATKDDLNPNYTKLTMNQHHHFDHV